MESKIENESVKFEQIMEAAKGGRWDFVDNNINESHLTDEKINWAINSGLFDEDKNIRDLSATLLDISDKEISEEDKKKLEEVMSDDSYDVVRYRVAIALYKRGYKDSVIEEVMLEAKEDPDLGQLVKSLIKSTNVD